MFDALVYNLSVAMNDVSPLKQKGKAYLPDRILSWLMVFGQVSAVFYAAWWYVKAWRADPLAPSSGTLLEWLDLHHYVNGLLSIGALIAFTLWLAVQVNRGHRWSFVVLAYLECNWLIPWIGYGSQAQTSTLLYLIVGIATIVYCALRVTQTIGPDRRYLGQSKD